MGGKRGRFFFILLFSPPSWVNSSLKKSSLTDLQYTYQSSDWEYKRVPVLLF